MPRPRRPGTRRAATRPCPNVPVPACAPARASDRLRGDRIPEIERAIGAQPDLTVRDRRVGVAPPDVRAASARPTATDHAAARHARVPPARGGQGVQMDRVGAAGPDRVADRRIWLSAPGGRGVGRLRRSAAGDVGLTVQGPDGRGSVVPAPAAADVEEGGDTLRPGLRRHARGQDPSWRGPILGRRAVPTQRPQEPVQLPRRQSFIGRARLQAVRPAGRARRITVTWTGASATRAGTAKLTLRVRPAAPRTCPAPAPPSDSLPRRARSRRR